MKKSNRELYDLAKGKRTFWEQFFDTLEELFYLFSDLFNQDEDTPYKERVSIKTTLPPDATFKQWKQAIQSNPLAKYDKENLTENGIPVKKLLKNLED